MMQTQIPSGLQALMQASQVLSSQASPTAPGPQGPQPTVAERVNQQIKQVAQPPQPTQGGIAGLTPNMREMGQQAGVAGQIMAQRQAQQQQQAQNPEAVAQMAAQMLQSKGVAGLPSNMGFKEGGIIGFDGEERSDVPAPNVPGMDKLMEIMANAEGTEVAGADNQVALQALEDARKNLAAAAKSQDFNAARFYAKKVADLQNEIKDESSKPVAWPNKPGVEVTREAPAQKSGIKQMTPAEIAQLRQNPYAASGIQQMTPAEVDKLRQNPYAREAAPAAPLPARAATPTTTAATTARADSGITQEDIKNRAQAILGSNPRPTMEGILAGAKNIYSNAETDAEIKERKKDFEAREALKASMEDLNKEGIATLEQDAAARKQLLASKAERDQFNRVQSFFRDLYTRGDSYGNVQAGIFARNEAERLADTANKKAITELKKAQQAEKLGYFDRKEAHMDKVHALRQERDKNLMEAAKISEHLATSVYNTEGTAATTAASTLSHERIEKDRLAMEAKKLLVMAQERKDAGLANKINAAQGQLSSAWKVLDKTKDEHKMGLLISDEAAAKDPTAKKMRDTALAEVKKTYDTVVAPAIATHDRLVNELGINRGRTPSNAGGGSAKPDFIWDQKTQKMVPNK